MHGKTLKNEKKLISSEKMFSDPRVLCAYKYALYESLYKLTIHGSCMHINMHFTINAWKNLKNEKKQISSEKMFSDPRVLCAYLYACYDKL